jgi:hypothetical protein
MIVALLVLIVLILLFGAGVVRGWIANTITMGCGFIAICLALIWVGSFFGENGFLYAVMTIAGVALMLAVVGAVFNEAGKARSKVTKPARPSELKSVDQVWGSFAHDIALRFSPEAQETARGLYDAGNVRELEQFCRRESRRLK